MTPYGSSRRGIVRTREAQRRESAALANASPRTAWTFDDTFNPDRPPSSSAPLWPAIGGSGLAGPVTGNSLCESFVRSF